MNTIDKFEEIKLLAESLPEQETPMDNDTLNRIIRICEDAIIQDKVERRLSREKRTRELKSD
jgi:hypothetical protein